MAFTGLKKDRERNDLVTHLLEVVRVLAFHSAASLNILFSAVQALVPNPLSLHYNHTRLREKL